MRPLQKSLPVFSWNLFERTVELGCVVDLLAYFCGPNLAVLYQVACALDEMHGADEQETERTQRNQAVHAYLK